MRSAATRILLVPLMAVAGALFLACGGDDGLFSHDAGAGDSGSDGGLVDTGTTSDGGGQDSGGQDSGGGKDGGPTDGGSDACATDTTAPTVTSSTADIGFPVGSTTADQTIVFSEPVQLTAGAITIDNGASVTVTPSLPASGTSFMVHATGLVDGTDYNLTLLAAEVVDACGLPMAADSTTMLVSGCASDTTPPTQTGSTDALTIASGATTAQHTFTFDEDVVVAADGIDIDNGGSVVVTPGPPATAMNFTVDMSGLSDAMSYSLTAQATSITDRCGNALASDATVAVVGECISPATPAMTSSATELRFAVGATTTSHTLTFTEPVTIAAGGLSIDDGASLTITPALPATASSFQVDVSGMVDGTNYTLSATAASITNACGVAVTADQSIPIVSCQGDTAPPVLTSDDVVKTCDSASVSYVMTFDEPTTLAAGALAIDGGGTIVSVTPALPATSTTFTLALDNITGTHSLTVATGQMQDGCGNASVATLSISATAGNAETAAFDYTGTILDYVIPSCPNVSIEAYGAQGGIHASSSDEAGRGAHMRGDFAALTTHKVRILVGQQPAMTDGNGGGGGSFVVTASNAPLLIAGGGGGSGDGPNDNRDGTMDTAGQSCTAGGGGTGGIDGNGGGVGASGFQSGAGGGLLTSGSDGWTSGSGGASFVLGGAGGSANPPANGGFGGGGTGSSYIVGGGGGGYSGGASCSNAVASSAGSGGGSYNGGTNQQNASGVGTGDGQVVIVTAP